MTNPMRNIVSRAVLLREAELRIGRRNGRFIRRPFLIVLGDAVLGLVCDMCDKVVDRPFIVDGGGRKDQKCRVVCTIGATRSYLILIPMRLVVHKTSSQHIKGLNVPRGGL